MSEDLQRGELKTKRRALRETRLQLARFGIGAPVHLIIQEQDLAKEVRAIERELGIEQTPTIRERGIEEGRGNIARIKDILRSYGIEVEDLAGDGVSPCIS